MQVKKRGITLKRLDQQYPGLRELGDPPMDTPAPAESVDHVAAPDDDLLVMTLDDLLLEVLEDLEDTRDLLSADARDTDPV